MASMIPISTAGSAALAILRQQAAPSTLPGVDIRPVAPAIAEDSYFGMNAMDVTARKVQLMERLGEAFGIAMEDHADARSFGMAIREIVEKLKTTPEGRERLVEVGRDLGLDRLGISIDTLIGAMVDPMGDDAEKLDAALKADMGETLEDEAEAELLARLARMGLDEAGLYGR